MSDLNGILFRSKRSVKVGELERYVITYEPKSAKDFKPQASLWLKIKNLENITLRAAFLRGPYILYVDVRSDEYHHSKTTFITADQPKFEPNLSPGQNFTMELSMHTIKEKYVWIVDVISQIIFSPTTDISFEVLIGSTKESLDVTTEKLGTFNDQLYVNRKNTLDLWHLPTPKQDKPLHLVILTHGLHSNLGADMFYIKDQLDSIASKTGENLIVRGYHHNVCKTEKGVKYLGTQLARFIIEQLQNDKITKISFIGHSLGGLIQIFAITYIELNCPWIFKKVQPVNFVTLASPLLGIVTDNPAYVKAALMFGIVGKTGQDLGLESSNGEEPLLLKLSQEKSTHRVLKMFKHRTIYANAFNDGIVPLYTASLLYLNWKKNDEEEEKEEEIIEPSKVTSNPFQKAISLLAPNAATESTSPSKSDSILNNFPKTSMIESATSILIPPLPSNKYLTQPNSRYDVILHDRVYTSKDIPIAEEKKKSSFMDKINYDPLSKFKELEEKIARNWHQDLSWRKVLVKLNPDAHNNIFVRRRFSNAYGWPVIDHLIDEHFSEVYEDEKTEFEPEVQDSDVDLGQDFKLGDDYDWVLKENNQDGIFDMGPTGLITNFNEILDNFKNWNLTNNEDIPEENINNELIFTNEVSEGYIP